MPFDAVVADLITQQGISLSQLAAARINAAAENLTQGLGVIHNTLIHSNGATADDGSQLASLQAAARSPDQGAIKG